MIRLILAVSFAALCACSVPPTPDTEVIIGATLLRDANPVMENSVIVVKDGSVAAVGTQQMTPIPPGSSKVEAYGKFVRHSEPGQAIQAGSKANLVLLSGTAGSDPASLRIERRMTEGRWVE